MSKLGSKEEILAAIQARFEQISSGNLSADELESLVELTRELHERALILRYKAYEEKVFGVRPVREAEPEVETPQEAPVAASEPEPLEEPQAEEPGEEQEAEAPASAEAHPAEAEEPVFDFDMFEKAEANLFAQPEPAQQEVSFPETEAQQIASEVEESPVTVSEQMPVQPEPEQEPAPAQEPLEEAPVAAYQEPEQQYEPEMPLPEELAIMNEPIIPEEKPQPQAQQAADNDMFSRIPGASSDGSLGSKLMASKLTTLIGAFGLNEKLQFIRELFNGSSEAFNQAIETLEQQENFAAAKRILAQYAQQNGWNLESNLTAEFIQKVERRFQ